MLRKLQNGRSRRPMVDYLPSMMHTRNCCGVPNATASLRATG